MYAAVARIALGDTELAVGMTFERRFRIFAIDRRGITFDTRFSPPIRKEPTNAVIVYLLLEGTLRWSDGEEVHGPALFLMHERDFEGSQGARERYFRSWGQPFRAVELRVARTDCTLALDADRAMVALTGVDDRLVAAGRLYLHASHGKKGQTIVADLAARYLKELHARGVLATRLSESIVRDEGLRGRLWEAMRPSLVSFGADAKQDELVERMGWSSRRVQRELVRIALAHGVGWLGGWRDVALRYRVRVAVLLLSNPANAIGDVARAVGYSSVEALAHALESCGLPSATAIRAELEAGRLTAG